MTQICVSKLTITGTDNGLAPGRRQAIIWTNAGILLIRTSRTNFSENWREIQAYSFKKMHLKMSPAKWRPFCLGLNVLIRDFNIATVGDRLMFRGRSYHSIDADAAENRLLNTLRPRQNGRHFTGDTFKRIFVNKNVRNFIKISLGSN